MANKQYIYSGTGNPNTNAVVPDSVTAHYLDTESSDIWLHDGASWRRIYVGGSVGMVAMYNDPSPISSPPTGPSIVSYNGNCYVSFEPGLGELAWQKLTITPP